jgi:hypothetical protein
VREVKGFRYLRTLLDRPGEEIPALGLSAAVSGATVDEPNLGEVLHRQALRAYRTRLAELDSELAEARDWADSARADL